MSKKKNGSFTRDALVYDLSAPVVGVVFLLRAEISQESVEPSVERVVVLREHPQVPLADLGVARFRVGQGGGGWQRGRKSIDGKSEFTRIVILLFQAETVQVIIGDAFIIWFQSHWTF